MGGGAIEVVLVLWVMVAASVSEAVWVAWVMLLAGEVEVILLAGLIEAV